MIATPDPGDQRFAEPAAGELIGPYRLARRLGRGGHAPVFLAEEIHDDKKLRDVALKLFVRPAGADPAAWRDAVLDEARALCRVEHPNVVRFLAVQRDDARGVLALVMEYVAGESLDARLRRTSRVEEREAIEIGSAIAWALAAVHHAGLVHRDVKPANVVAGASGYKLIDFGIVVGNTPGAAPPPLVGTRGFVAPECVERGAPPAPTADLYALGVTLFRLITGAMPGETASTLPFDPSASEADTRETITGSVVARAAPTIDVSPGTLGGLIGRLLEHDPHARPQHAEGVARELDRLCGDRDDETEEAPPSVARASRGGLAVTPVLVGRDREMASIARAVDDVRGGALRVIVMGGPLGVGRTRMLEEAIAASRFPTGRVLFAQCSPERHRVLGPIAHALEAIPAEGARALAALEEAMELAIAPPELGDAREAESAVEAVEDALIFATAGGPLLLAIDDLQWGDPHTLTLLRLLVDRAARGARGGDGGLLVLASARHEPSPSPALAALLGRARSRTSPAVEYMALAPLPGDDAARLAAAMGPLAPDLAAAVARGSGGVPFFLVHALGAWRDTQAIALRDGVWRAIDERVLAGEVPGVAEIVAARIAGCFEPSSAAARAAHRALAAIALHGGGLGVDLLHEIVGGDDTLEIALEALVDAGLVQVSGDCQEYGFAQEMVRQAALNLTRSRPWFFRLHRALLDAIARRPSADRDATFLATGYEKLGAVEPARRWLARAMDAASASGLAAEASDLGDRLAAIAPDAVERTRVELEIVRALLHGRRFEEARARLSKIEARAAVLPEIETRASSLRRRIDRLRAARGLHEPGIWDASLAEDVDAHGDPSLACEARMALAGVARVPLSLALAGEAVDRAEAAGPALEYAARVLRAELAYAAAERDLHAIGADLSRALAIASATSSRWQRIHIEGDLAAIEAEQGRAEAAIERLTRLFAEAEAHGMRGQARLLSQNLAAVLLREGRAIEAAEAAARTSRLALSAGDPVLAANAMSIRADALRRAGDLEAALASIADAELLQRDNGDRMRSLTLLRRAEILAALGRSEEARADAASSRALAEGHGERGVAVIATLWETIHAAEDGRATRADVERARAAATLPGVAPRALTRSIVARADAFLARPAT